MNDDDTAIYQIQLTRPIKVAIGGAEHTLEIGTKLNVIASNFTQGETWVIGTVHEPGSPEDGTLYGIQDVSGHVMRLVALTFEKETQTS